MRAIFSAKELSEIFSCGAQRGVYDVCVNSKEVKSGDLFVALRGQNVDAHDFVPHALKNGAPLAIVEKKIEGAEDDRLIIVESSLEALKKLAKYNMSRSNAKIIGVTGSVGKTTTKDILHHILYAQEELKNELYVSRKNFNSEIGLPICAATMPLTTKVGIFEMGMSVAGDIKKLINIVPPKISLITSICETHLEFFESVFAIAEAKSEIFETTVPQEVALIPSDCAYVDFLRDRALNCGIKDVFSFGLAENSHVKIESFYIEKNHMRVLASFLGEKIEYKLKCNNLSTVWNSISAIFVAHVASGIALRKLAAAVETFTPTPNRGEVVHLSERNIVIIDDCYNSCPASLRSAIQSMSARYAGRRKIAIIGDMRELGGDSRRFHEDLSATIDKFGVDLVFTCGNLAKYLFDNLKEEKKGGCYENSEQLSKKIWRQIQDGDCILVKGSRSMKMELVVEAIQKIVN